MLASDISRIVFELIRVQTDRMLMEWEDDRGHLLKRIGLLSQENKSLLRKRRQDEKTSKLLMSEILDIKSRIENRENNSLARNKFDLALHRPELCCNGDVNADSPLNPNVFNSSVNSTGLCNGKIRNSFPQIMPTSSSSLKRSLSHIEENNLNINTITSDKKISATTPEKLQNRRRNQVTTNTRSISYRENLPGHICDQCRKYFEVLEQQGIAIDMTEMLRNCSRHKSVTVPPPSTPEGYWDLTVSSPPAWNGANLAVTR